MGRLNTSYLIYIIKNRFLKILPYKYRKPFLLIFSIVSLYGYFKFMVFISTRLFGKPSTYLISLQIVIKKIIGLFKNSYGTNGTIFIFLCLGLILMYKYILPTQKKTAERKYYGKSLYYEINSIISMCYLIITILTFLPFLIR